jgi:hypothetical protein
LLEKPHSFALSELEQTFEWKETWENDKTFIPLPSTAPSSNRIVFSTFSISLPLRLSHCYWTRHGFTLEDIMMLLDEAPLQYLWILVTAYNLSFSNHNIVKRNLSDTEEVQFSGGRSGPSQLLKNHLSSTFPSNKKAMKLILPSGLVQKLFPKSNSSFMSTQQLENLLYPVPLHSISSKAFYEIQKLFQSRKVDDTKTIQWYTSSLYRYSHGVEWSGITLLPHYSLYQNSVLTLVRVVPYHLYLRHLGRPQKPLKTPFLFWIQSELYCSLEEMFYIVCNQER